MENYVGQDVPKLGFGLMRLPTLADESIDFAHLEQMVDAFLRAGFTYFDTAYGYMGGLSEEAAKRALVKRHPRESFLLATKLPPWLLGTKEDMRRVFDTQLERTGAGYFDYYLLHSVGSGSLQKLNDLDAWSFLAEKKKAGLIRHIGFSFHDNAEVLESVLKDHPEVEFVQLQINYADWEDEKVQSRLCYEVARKYGKSVIVMEPVKGGALATLSGDALAAFEAARPGMSAASWAMRYAASLDGLVTVLSGMSDMAQMRDNIHTMTSFEPLTEGDRAVLEKVQAILAETPTVPCTDCRYCMENCPQNIAIPRILDVENRRRIYGQTDKRLYGFATNNRGKASDCVACGVCESRCPQHIEIIDLLRECAETFE